jgi:hypothetical protein
MVLLRSLVQAGYFNALYCSQKSEIIIKMPILLPGGENVMKKQAFPGVFLALAALGVSGCASTKIVSNHPLMEKSGSGPYATVYFLRPNTERAMGFPDNPLTIEMDQEKLLTLGKGEYTMLRLKPRITTTMTLKSKTAVGPNWTIKEMSKDKKWSFAAGQTYFLVLKPVDGEFRGVYFVAESVDLFSAKEVAPKLHAVSVAKPISAL